MDQGRRKFLMKALLGSVGLLAFAAGAFTLTSTSASDDGEASQSSSANSLATVFAGTQAVSQSLGSAEISVRVVYFGMPAIVTGSKKETVSLPSPAYLSDLKSALVKLHPGLKDMLPAMLFLVDGVTATGNPRLENNWEVDILALTAGG